MPGRGEQSNGQVVGVRFAIPAKGDTKTLRRPGRSQRIVRALRGPEIPSGAGLLTGARWNPRFRSYTTAHVAPYS